MRAARWIGNRVDPWSWARIQYVRLGPFIRERRSRSRYTLLGEAQLRAARRSETVFVFGSGASLNELQPREWDHVARHDTLGFNYFIRQRFVRLDYHMVGEIATGSDTDRARWTSAIAEYAALLNDNPLHERTILGLQSGWMAYQSNRLVASGLLRPGSRIFRYRRISRGVYRPPTRSLSEGLVHGSGAVVACVNFAYLMGWREIVLAGVDLYDSRYFWLPPDQARPDLAEAGRSDPDRRHSTAEQLVPFLEKWHRLMAAESVRLSVYGSRSLLARVLPVYSP
jgi:hypothetical protein